MIIKKLKGVNFSDILIVVLLIIILLQKCSGGNSEHPTAPQITKDTVWVQKSSTITTKPQLIKSIPYPVPIDRWNTEYVADTNYAKLVLQYQELVKELLSTNYYRDSLHVDSLGYVIIKDTVSRNTILGRSFDYDFHYPMITKTVTVLEKKRGQVYIGMGIGGVNDNLINKLNLGLMYKNKQDVMFGPTLSIEQNGTLLYGVQAFWKIKLRK